MYAIICVALGFFLLIVAMLYFKFAHDIYKERYEKEE